ncbi:hypothetical protein IAR55_005349 [Kwoniella newhampshirensis]|uniref:Uncharacterized protein n=1 Tax=Kwoniella newhampshirensis TaxID=1651941 RepID=A0AAW0YI97_9TREE
MSTKRDKSTSPTSRASTGKPSETMVTGHLFEGASASGTASSATFAGDRDTRLMDEDLEPAIAKGFVTNPFAVDEDMAESWGFESDPEGQLFWLSESDQRQVEYHNSALLTSAVEISSYSHGQIAQNLEDQIGETKRLLSKGIAKVRGTEYPLNQVRNDLATEWFEYLKTLGEQTKDEALSEYYESFDPKWKTKRGLN